jgi:DNA polymerase-3 subunit beta
MKFQVEKTAMNSALKVASSAIAKNGIAASILISESGIRSTNLEQWWNVPIDSGIDSSGSVLVDASKLKSIVEGAKDDLIFEMKGDHLIIKSGSSRYRLLTGDTKSFPDMPELNGDTFQIAIDAVVLNRLINSVKGCVAINDVRYFLNGICLELEGDEIIAIATDGRILGTAAAPISVAEPVQLLINNGMIRALQAALSSDDGDVIITLNGISSGMQLTFSSGATMHSQLVSGKFPTWRRVIPDGNPKVLARFSRRDLLESVGRIMFTKNTDCTAVLSFRQGQLDMTVTTAEEESFETCNYLEPQSGLCDISINPKYLTTILGSIPDDEVTVTVFGTETALLITSSNGRYIITPMRS